MENNKPDCRPEISERQNYFADKKPVLLPFGKTIYQFKNAQSVSSDAVFLVKYILDKNPDISQNLQVLELGSGNGIVSLMLAFYRPLWQISGIEIQPELAELSQINAESSKQKIHFIEGDFRIFPFPKKYDLIISNPPYFPKEKGLVSPHKIRAISRHEIFCTLPEVFSVVAANLKSTGTAFVLYPLFRLAEMEKFTKKVDLKIADKFLLKAGKGKNKILVKLEF